MKELMNNEVWCPLNGTRESLDNVKDAMFKEEMLGKTICVLPDDTMVYAPFDGTITVMYPSSHAIGIVRNDGLEVLIHVGIDTVELNGEGFESQVKQGDVVKRQDPLLKFNPNIIQNRGYSDQTFIVFTNSKEFIVDNISSNDNFKIKDVLAYAEKI